MRFPSLEYWSGWSFPSPGDLPGPGMEPVSPALAGKFFTKRAVPNFDIEILIACNFKVTNFSQPVKKAKTVLSSFNKLLIFGCAGFLLLLLGLLWLRRAGAPPQYCEGFSRWSTGSRNAGFSGCSAWAQ